MDITTLFADVAEIKSIVLNLQQNNLVKITPELSDESLITEKEACAITKLSRQSLKKFRDNNIVKFQRFGGAIRYKRSELLNLNRKSKAA